MILNRYIVLFIISVVFISCISEDEEVVIENSALRLCIANTLKKEVDDKIYESEVATIKELVCRNDNIHNISGVEKLINLERLELEGKAALDDFYQIGDLKKLKVLYLDGYKKDNTFLSNLSELEVLVLLPTVTSTLSSIENLNLKSLELFYGWEKLPQTILNSIAKITSLERLYLGRNKISNIDFLKALVNLKLLKIDDNDIKDLSPISNLLNLEELNLNNNRRIIDLSPIKDLISLQVLGVANIGIKDITSIENLINLELLHAYNNDIEDILPLQNLTKLIELQIYKNNIMDITPLKSLTNLKLLYLNSNPELSDPSPLKNHVNLEILTIYYSKINSFDFLENLTKLEEVSFTGNYLGDITGIEKAIYLKRLDLKFNHITNVAPLRSLSLDLVNVSYNCISDFTPLEHIPNVYGDSDEVQTMNCK